MIFLRSHVIRSLEEVIESDWVRLARGRSVFQQLSWFRAASPTGTLRILVISANGVARAILPLAVLYKPEHYYHTPKEILCGFREQSLLVGNDRALRECHLISDANWFPCVVSVSPHGYRGGLLVEEDDPDLEQIFDAASQAAEEIAQSEGAQLLFLHYLNDDDDARWLPALERRGFTLVVAGADCNLEIEWTTLDQYFESLGASRCRRVRAAHRQALESSEVRWRCWSTDSRPGPTAEMQIVNLISLAARRHEDRSPPRQLYQMVLERTSERLVAAGEAPNGDLRSAMIVLHQGKTFYPKFFGQRVGAGDYFHLVFSGLVETALRSRVRRIEFGGGSHQAKVLRGAKLRWCYAAVKAFDSRLIDSLESYLPLYDNAKTNYFSGIAERYQTDHTPPARRTQPSRHFSRPSRLKENPP